jgi:hypothetical protein
MSQHNKPQQIEPGAGLASVPDSVTNCAAVATGAAIGAANVPSFAQFIIAANEASIRLHEWATTVGVGTVAASRLLEATTAIRPQPRDVMVDYLKARGFNHE